MRRDSPADSPLGSAARQPLSRSGSSVTPRGLSTSLYVEGQQHSSRASANRPSTQELSVASMALNQFGSSSSAKYLTKSGTKKKGGRKASAPDLKKRIKSCMIDSEQTKSEVLNAAVSIYRILYAPKGTINNKNAHEWEKFRVRSLMYTFAAASGGVLLAVWENELLWGNHRIESTATFWLKLTQVATSIVVFFFLNRYYRACIAEERLRGVPLHNGSVTILNLKACGLWGQAFMDIICLLPQPLPWLDIEVSVYNDAFNQSCNYPMDVLLTVLMFLRIRLFPRFYGECVSSVRTEITRAYGNVTRLEIGEVFIFKYLITTNLGMVLMLWFVQIVFFAYCLMMFERPMSFINISHSQLYEYNNCLWCTVITMTIVGYGDTYPMTRLGRATMMIASLSALIMVAISTHIVQVLLSQSRKEAKCVEVMGLLEGRDDVKIKAAELIQASWRAYLRISVEMDAARQQRAVDAMLAAEEAERQRIREEKEKMERLLEEEAARNRQSDGLFSFPQMGSFISRVGSAEEEEKDG
eukprot:CAMPEP_0181299462 /NCGR_PEP_ID=MMETSP1101-20121128/6360_1 /TAXON_ID=46948 /ORGANISM="Rhodomonas abbreviata, Strain Caron Lab Isolate" /LENGTH=526 /DNA_ID=CAMNT_0023404615 /DNA_START=115 /DNA_END=1691 /DNA_ORIENTATION=+